MRQRSRRSGAFLREATRALILFVARQLGFSPLKQHELDSANGATRGFTDYFSRALSDRRANSDDDLISGFVAANESREEPYSELQIVANIILTYIGGQDTQKNALGNAIVALYRHPEEFEWLSRQLVSVANNSGQMATSHGGWLARIGACSMTIEGGCYCGTVRYAVDGEPKLRGMCFCRECQHIAGGGPNVLIAFAANDFRYAKGQPQEFARSDLAEPARRQFCPNCGTHLATISPRVPGAVLVKVGSLDDPSLYGMPDAAIYTSEAQPYHVVPPGVPTFAKRPDS